MAQTSPLYVPQARPAPIDDRLLDQLAKVGDDARRSLTTEAEAEWLLSVVGPLLRELQAWRQMAAQMQLSLPADNIILLGAR